MLKVDFSTLTNLLTSVDIRLLTKFAFRLLLSTYDFNLYKKIFSTFRYFLLRSKLIFDFVLSQFFHISTFDFYISSIFTCFCNFWSTFYFIYSKEFFSIYFHLSSKSIFLTYINFRLLSNKFDFRLLLYFSYIRLYLFERFFFDLFASKAKIDFRVCSKLNFPTF